MRRLVLAGVIALALTGCGDTAYQSAVKACGGDRAAVQQLRDENYLQADSELRCSR